MNRAKRTTVVVALLFGLLGLGGTTPALAKTAGCPKLKFTPGNAQFGNIPVGSQASVTVTVENTSATESADISLIVPDPMPPFGIDGTDNTCMGGEFAPGATCKLVLTCAPNKKKKYTGDAIFSFATKGCKEQKVKLTCDGVAPVATATATATATKTATLTATATATATPTPTATSTPPMANLLNFCATPTVLDNTGEATDPVVVAGAGVGSAVWLRAFNTIFFAFIKGSIWSTPRAVLTTSDTLSIIAMTGDPTTNTSYVLFGDQTTGTLNVLAVSSDGTTASRAASTASTSASRPVSTAASAVSLGSFDTGKITFDPSTGTIYAAVQSGFNLPQLFVSNDGGNTFGPGPTLPTLPNAIEFLQGVAANSGTLSFLFLAEHAQLQVIMSSGGGAFSSPITLFSDTNGGFSTNGVAMNSAGTLATSVLDTPNGGTTSLIQILLASGSTSPTQTTLASSMVSQGVKPGGGIQSNNDTAFGFINSGDFGLNIAQLAAGPSAVDTSSTRPLGMAVPLLPTGCSSKDDGAWFVYDGFGVWVCIPGVTTPGDVEGGDCDDDDE